MLERRPVPAGKRHRARAEECRIQAEVISRPEARTQILQLAADYDRKAEQVEAIEVQKPKTNKTASASEKEREALFRV